MSKKNKNEAPVRTASVGFKTKKGANNEIETNNNIQKKTVSKEAKRTLIITIIGSVLIVAAVASIVATLVAGILSGDEFDYLKENLNSYISLSKEEYTNLTVDHNPVEYSDEMLQREIDALLVKHKRQEPENAGKSYVNVAVSLGDIAYIRYRGYTVDENGRETEVDGECNFNDTALLPLEIGSQTMPGSFEHLLIGKVPSDYEDFAKVKAGEVLENDVIYLSYIAYYPSGAATSAEYERIDLSRTDIDEVYGEGFKAYLVGKEIGTALDSATFKQGAGTAAYSDMRVEFATRCESEPLTIDVTFPNDYTDSNGNGKELRGVTVKYDVYLDSVVVYETPEYDASFVTDTLGFTEEELSEYNGADIVAKHTEYVKAKCLENIAIVNKTLQRELVWDLIKDKGEIIKYPEAELERIYNAYYSEVESYYSTYADTYGYESIDAAAVDYYNLTSGADWQAYITEKAKTSIREDLVLYYIMKKEDFVPTDEEYSKKEDELIQEQLEYYLEAHEDEMSAFEGEEYDEQVELIRNGIKETYAEVFEYAVYKITCLDKLIAKYVTVT